MKRKNWVIAAAVTIAGLVFGFIGCDKDDDNVSPTPENFSVELDASYFEWTDYFWIIRHSEAGTDSVIRLDAAGVANFGDIYEPDVNWTMICVYNNLCSIISYVDAPRGHWFFKDPRAISSHDTEMATVTLTFPEGYYSSLRCETIMSSTTSNFGDGGPWSQCVTQLLCPTPLLSDGTITIIASVSEEDGLPSHIGYILDQDYSIGSANEYTIDLNREMTPREIQCTRDVEYLSIRAIRDPLSTAGYYISSTPGGFDGTAYVLEDFPASEYITMCSGYSGPYYHYSVRTSELPSTLSIPQTDITFAYDENSGIYRDIVVTNGSADYLNTRWWYQNNFVSGTGVYSWEVFSDVQSEISRPSLPPEILSEMNNFDPLVMETQGIILYESDAYEGFAEYAHGEFMSSSFDPLINGTYLFKYSCSSIDEASFESIHDDFEK